MSRNRLYTSVALQMADLRPPVVRSDDDFALGVLSALNAAARSLARIYAADSPNFERAAFLKTCGLPADPLCDAHSQAVETFTPSKESTS